MKRSFSLGRLVATPGALGSLNSDRLAQLVARHAAGDWGVVDAEDQATNNRAVVDGDRILSAYPIDEAQPCAGHGDNTVWIITEADRSTTTLLLPSEY
jgi:hypothetical protein